MDGNMGTSLIADFCQDFNGTFRHGLFQPLPLARQRPEAARGVNGARLNRNGEELYRWRSDSRGAPALFIPRVNIADLARSDGTHRGDGGRDGDGAGGGRTN
jgi:hypothetical protein